MNSPLCQALGKWRAVAMATGAWSDIVAGHFGEVWPYVSPVTGGRSSRQ